MFVSGKCLDLWSVVERFRLEQQPAVSMVAVCVLASGILGGATSNHAQAQKIAEPELADAAARADYLAKLDARIKQLEQLEQRIRALDPAQSKAGALTSVGASGKADSQVVKNKAGAAVPVSAASAASAGAYPLSVPIGAGTVTSDKADVKPGTEVTTSADQQIQKPPTIGPDGKPVALSSNEDADALRDLQVIRDSVVTVKKGGIDVSSKLDYVRSSSSLQFSRALISSNSIRYGLLPGVEISMSIPGYYSSRETQVGPSDYINKRILVLGDVSAQVTATLMQETLQYPGLSGYVSVSAPTGPDPYWVDPGQSPFPVPVNPFYFTQSAGHWGGTVGATVAKTLEPIIVYAGVSYTHFLARDFAGSSIQPGDRFGYRMGFGLAVSERTTLGAALQGGITKDLVMDGTVRRGLSTESVLLTLALTQRLPMNFYVEPSVTIGMTSDAPSSTVSLAVRKSF
jgi:hypothetical protein